MKPITRLYVKTFFLTGVPYGLCMMGVDWALGNGFRWGRFLFLMFFFGLTMSLVLVSLHKYKLRKLGVREIDDDNIGVRQSRKLSSRLSLSELTDKLKANSATRKMRVKEIENGILLKTGISWKSWGEIIKIVLKNRSETGFEYQITSYPKLKTSLVDYGKSIENINRIEELLKD